MIRVIVALIALVCFALPAAAHEVRPAYLEITEHADGAVDVLFKQPAGVAQALALTPRLSGGALDAPPTLIQSGDGFQTRIWRGVRLRDGPLDGRTLTIEGLDRTITDALVVVTFANGDRVQHLLKPGANMPVLDARGAGQPVWAYLRLGVEHILLGFDHLLFILGLVVLVRGLWPLTKMITAFTVAHSITLGATALGVIAVESAIVEMLVALSILFVAVEVANARRGVATLTQRWPWLIAFAFGLLHGSALAGALAEIGLPRENIASALFLFNAGVELGQLIFVATACALGFALTRLAPALVPRLALVPAYLIGIAAVFWMCERFAAVLA